MFSGFDVESVGQTQLSYQINASNLKSQLNSARENFHFQYVP